MSVGAQSVLYPHRPTPDAVFDLIARHRPTIFFGVPTLYAAMLAAKDAERRFDLSSLRLCVSAGEALPADLYRRWHERFGVEIVDGIGTTETGHIFLSNRPGAVRPGSSGLPVPGYECAVVDDEGRPVPAGEIGNLRVRGDSTMAYYWNQHEKTKATLIGPWIQTGDKYHQDADGYYWYDGRGDDMLKVGGIWVSPVEVEATLDPARRGPRGRGGRPGGRRPAGEAPRLRRAEGSGPGRRRRSPASSAPSSRTRSPPTSTRGGSTSSPSCRRRRPARSSGSSCARAPPAPDRGGARCGPPSPARLCSWRSASPAPRSRGRRSSPSSRPWPRTTTRIRRASTRSGTASRARSSRTRTRRRGSRCRACASSGATSGRPPSSRSWAHTPRDGTQPAARSRWRLARPSLTCSSASTRGVWARPGASSGPCSSCPTCARPSDRRSSSTPRYRPPTRWRGPSTTRSLRSSGAASSTPRRASGRASASIRTSPRSASASPGFSAARGAWWTPAGS